LDDDMNNVVGVYSFPKSGNTLVRKIIGEYFGINVKQFPRFIPDVHSAQKIGEGFLETNQRKYYFYKSHTYYPIKLPEKVASFSRFYIYIVRNPLDVFCSYINYVSGNLGKKADIPVSSIEGAVESGTLDVYLKSFFLFGQIQPHFFSKTSSWYENAESWMDRSEKLDNVFFVYYEDLVSGNFDSLVSALVSIGLDEGKVRRICNIFINEPLDGKFIFKKTPYSFLDYLTHRQVEEFLVVRGEILRKLNYLDIYKSMLRRKS
tara:strand:- start:2652 stop:3437 length:786 start_codon:yes stop_codon:yes gene_type:complete